MIEELAEVIPQEKAIMLTAGQQLVQQGRLEERQNIASSMLAEGVDPQFVKGITHYFRCRTS